MPLRSAVEQEIRDLIREHGRITFARFMSTCLYSLRGGFYRSASESIGAHFGTSSVSHAAFGTLIARQLEQMWQLLEEPSVFHVIEVGSGDGSLARSIVDASSAMHPRLARALCYVAADYEPTRARLSGSVLDAESADGIRASSRGRKEPSKVHCVRADGVRGFHKLVGCILSNELIDNFPVHRFAIRDGRVNEIYVTLCDDNLTEVLDEPSTTRLEERLDDLQLSLPEGYRSEVNLAMDDWMAQAAGALDRGFVLTIDYGGHAADVYSAGNDQGTLVCYHRHGARDDPYRAIGQQDITCHVDFTTLMHSGDRNGLRTVGYAPQREFLANLGFSSLLDALDGQGLSAARTALSRMAMTALVDPEQYGDLKVLAQAKGVRADVELIGLARGKSASSDAH